MYWAAANSAAVGRVPERLSSTEYCRNKASLRLVRSRAKSIRSAPVAVCPTNDVRLCSPDSLSRNTKVWFTCIDNCVPPRRESRTAAQLLPLPTAVVCENTGLSAASKGE